MVITFSNCFTVLTATIATEVELFSSSILTSSQQAVQIAVRIVAIPTGDLVWIGDGVDHYRSGTGFEVFATTGKYFSLHRSMRAYSDGG